MPWAPVAPALVVVWRCLGTTPTFISSGPFCRCFVVAPVGPIYTFPLIPILHFLLPQAATSTVTTGRPICDGTHPLLRLCLSLPRSIREPLAVSLLLGAQRVRAHPLKSTRHGIAARRPACTGAPSSAAPERRRLAATSSTARRTILCRSEATAFGHSFLGRSATVPAAPGGGRRLSSHPPFLLAPHPSGGAVHASRCVQLQRHSQSPARQPSHSAAPHPAG
jgi:hypothetical protein